MKPQTIELHIQELVLHGFAPADRRPIADAIERELHTLFTREGLPAGRSFEIASLNGGSFQIEQATRQQSAGANVAHAIYGGLRQ